MKRKISLLPAVVLGVFALAANADKRHHNTLCQHLCVKAVQPRVEFLTQTRMLFDRKGGKIPQLFIIH